MRKMLRPKKYHEQDNKEHERQTVEDVDDTHHHVVYPPTDKARGRTIGDANQQTDDSRKNANQK